MSICEPGDSTRSLGSSHPGGKEIRSPGGRKEHHGGHRGVPDQGGDGGHRP